MWTTGLVYLIVFMGSLTFERRIGPLVFAGRRSGPLEILRDGDRIDIWRHCAVFAAVAADR